jgi:hypothetical protein
VGRARAAVARAFLSRAADRVPIRIQTPGGRLSGAGGTGSPVLMIRDQDAFYRRLGSGTAGLAEAYMTRAWDCDDLPGLFTVLAGNVTTLGLQWRAARPVIDGGMAAAIRDQQTRRRTLTVYTDLRRVTAPLGISDRNTIWLFLTDRVGRVRWRGSGGWDPATADGLAAALDGLPGHAAAAEPASVPGAGQFEMAFDPRFRIPLAVLGVTPATAHVTVTADRLVACFGPWTCRTTPGNVRAVDVAGPYHWYRAVGPRLSLADHGLTFGTTAARGVCLPLREPVPGIDPLGLLRHPGLTLTVADPGRFAATVRQYAGLPAPGDAAAA